MKTNGSDSQQEQNQQRPTLSPPPQQRQPQWVASMQYPAATAMMITPPQHYMAPLAHQLYMAPPPYHQYTHSHAHVQQHAPPQQQQSQNQGANEENKTVWVGDLDHWMDENYLHTCFASTCEIASIKVIRNKHTGLSEGYGFVEFFSHATAEKVLENYTRILMPNTDRSFRLNWATFSTGEKRSDNDPDLSIYVGDLASDVSDSVLLKTFASKYPSVKAVKVVVDANTGRSKGYGFVRFGDESERTKAMTEMNGVVCSTRPMRIGAATPRKSSGFQQGGYLSNVAPSQADGDSLNTTIFVGGLDPSVTDDDLRQPFAPYGEIVSVKIPVGKGCGFVQFTNRDNAEEALQKLNGTVIGKQTVRLSWGRNTATKQFQAYYGNTWVGAYKGGYGYGTVPPQDAQPYATAAYGTPYGGHQQQVS